MRQLLACLCLLLLLAVNGCSSNDDSAHTTATTVITPAPTQVLKVVPIQALIDQMESQPITHDGKPVLKILSPAMDAVINSPKVIVKFSVGRNFGGQMKYRSAQPGPGYVVDPAAGFREGTVAVLLDGQLCQANLDPINPLELRNLPPGIHTLQAFVLRSSGSYKNPAAFQAINFRVTGSGYIPHPAPTDRDAALTGPYQCLGPAPLPEPINLSQARLVTTMRDGEVQDPVKIDFWLVNADLKSDGGQYRVRYFIDDDDARYIDKWEPVWLSGWIPGKHTVRLELLGADQYPVPNGITTREITVVK